MRVERTETITIARDVLRLTAPLLVAGKVLRPGALVEIDEIETAGLLARKVAVRATADEVDGAEVTSAPRSRIKRIGE